MKGTLFERAAKRYAKIFELEEKIQKKLQEYGAMMRKAREEKGLSQVELAKRAGISPSTVFNMEHGKQVIKSQTLEKISNVLYQ